MGEVKEQVVLLLENLVRKVKTQTLDAGDVDFHIYPAQAAGSPYLVEVSQERFVRRVTVDPITVQRLKLGQPDPVLMRDLRTAILAVVRLARRRQ